VESVILGFKSYDIHELACHFVARQAGLYRRHGLRVRLTDTNYVTDGQFPPRTFHAACGAALTAWFDGADTRVVFVAADRPMFWLYARPDLGGPADLDGGVVAGYPAAAPPAIFLRAILRARSIDPERVTTIAARDDVARIGLLSDDSASAALISSATAPQSLAERGFAELLFCGDEIRVPTTGLAVGSGTIESAPELVAAMSRCHREALTLIHHEAGVLEEALAEFVTGVGAEQAVMADRVRACYTRDGRMDAAALDGAIGLVSAALGRPAPGARNSLYDFSMLDAD